MPRLYRFALPLSLLLLASLACSVDLGTAATTAPTPSPVAVLKDLGFEAPADGSQLPFGPVEVKTYAWVDVGITRAELNINGVTLRTDPVTNEKVNGAFALTHITQLWTPPGPGTYTLSVRVQDSLGNLYTINTITVHIVDGGTATTVPVDGPPTETPTLTATATLDVSATRPRITFTPSSTTNPALAASATNTSTATLTVTVAAAAVGTPFTTFTADSTTINAGQCTTLRWTSGGIQSIFLDNQPVTGAENKQVCPVAPTTYILRANSTSGEITKQVTIQVSGGPPFTTFTADSTSLSAGQCTLLHWTSGNIQSIFLNNQAATGNENRQVCPTATTTYTLLAHSASGDITKQITITVTGSGPTATNTNTVQAPTATNTNTVPAPGGGPAPKPVLSGPVLSSAVFYNRSACGPTSLTITVTVTNATSVTLNFSIPGGVSGIAPMNTSNNTDWSYTLHVDDTLEIPTQPTGMLNFSFKAQGPGGTTSSITYNVIPLEDCP